jgi:hypothetical protein
MLGTDNALQPKDLAGILAKIPATSPIYPGAFRVLETSLAPKRRVSFPAPASSGRKCFLTVAMATFDDYDGVYFTVQALRMFHPEIAEQVEILVLDNNPEGPCAKSLQKLMRGFPHGRYLPFGGISGTAVRDQLFRQAQGEWVLVMDSHVLFQPGALDQLVRHLQENPESNDLWQGPLLYDNLRNISTHFLPVWSHGMYGVWSYDSRADQISAEPFEIPMQGLGVFVCRREAWPGFNPRMSGFGGEEGYIHEKFRQRGNATYCLPFLRWIHRFDRPMGNPYRPQWRHRVRNYLVGWEELGLDPQPVIDHFNGFLGAAEAQPMVDRAQRECAGPFHRFDAVYSLTPQSERDAWEAVGLDAKIRFIPPIEIEAYPEVARTLAHRFVLAEARMQNLETVLVFEEDVTPDEELPSRFRDQWDALGNGSWKVRRIDKAIVYHRDAAGELLDAIPDTPGKVALWLQQTGGLEALLEKMRGA